MSPVYDDLVRLIGEVRASVLIERLGGSAVYVPATPRRGSQLVLAIGMQASAALCKAFGGERLELPSLSALQAQHRRCQVISDLRDGRSVSDVARRNGLSARHVRRIREAG
jgi:hypothetical protein